MAIIGIVGSRRRDSSFDFSVTKSKLEELYQDGDTLVSGGCWKGGDKFCELLALQKYIPIKIYKAEWEKYGKFAGFQRNTLIASDADILIACVASDRRGGTEDTIRKFLKMGKTKLYLV